MQPDPDQPSEPDNMRSIGDLAAEIVALGREGARAKEGRMNTVVRLVPEPQHTVADLVDYATEEALLAALLVNNGTLGKVRGFLRAEHFADALSGRIYTAICGKVDAGERADAVTLKRLFDQDAALSDLGGGQYLARLTNAVVTTVGVEDYGKQIQDFALRRATVQQLGDAQARVYDYTQELPAIVTETSGALADTLAEIPAPGKGVRRPSDYTADVLHLYEGFRRPKFSTGWSSIDKLFQIREGELSVVTGWPSSGKSEFVDALCVNLAVQQGWTFALCSFENPPDEHLAKLAEKHVGKPFWPGPTQRMTPTDLEFSLDWVNHHFTLIRAEDESPTIDWLLRAATVAVERHGIHGLVIDPYNEMEHRRPPGVTETDYISGMLAKVKRWAAKHSVHVWFIAHPAKPTKLKDGSVPALSLFDISGSANWNNKADIGVVVNRKPDSIEVEIDVKKVRFKAVGIAGSATLEYDRPTGRYREALGPAAHYGAD